MKTNIFNIENRYVAKTGWIVPVDYVQTDVDDFDIVMADEVCDVCTGERFGLERHYEIGKTGYFLADIIDEDCYRPYKKDVRPQKKRSRRAERFDKFGGTYYNRYSGLKQVGVNRLHRRRMAQNAHQQYEYSEEWLPF